MRTRLLQARPPTLEGDHERAGSPRQRRAPPLSHVPGAGIALPLYLQSAPRPGTVFAEDATDETSSDTAESSVATVTAEGAPAEVPPVEPRSESEVAALDGGESPASTAAATSGTAAEADEDALAPSAEAEAAETAVEPGAEPAGGGRLGGEILMSIASGDPDAAATGAGEVAEAPALELPSFTLLHLEPIADTLDAPATAGLDEKSLPPQNEGPDGPRTTVATALSEAERQYAATLAAIRRSHERLTADSNAALGEVAESYQALSGSLPPALEAADATMAGHLSEARARVEDAAAAADAEITARHVQASNLLRRTAASARGAIAANADSAQSRISSIIDRLSEAFTEPVSDAMSECDAAALYATERLEAWQRGIPGELRVHEETPGMIQAEREAKGKAAPAMVTRALSQVAENIATISGSLSEAATQARTDVDEAVSPPLNEHAGKIRTEGGAAISRALRHARTSLEEQTRAARDAVARLRVDTLNMLINQHLAARRRLVIGARAVLDGGLQQARSAGDALHAAAEVATPLYGDAARQLKDTLANTARFGADALEQTAEQAGGPVAQSMEDAQAMQSRQARVIADGVRDGLGANETSFLERATEDTASSASRMTATADSACDTLTDTAARMTESFSSLGENITAAAETWARPLDQHFRDYIASAEESLRPQAETFSGQMSQRVIDFVGWATPRWTPHEFFERDLVASWTPVRTRMEERIGQLEAAMSHGIIDRVDESGMTRAVRGTTRAQGNGLRELWRDRHSSSLDNAIWDALNDDPDDYHAAINYLNGNTAIGARYELEASMHWYNDDEARIEEVMRSLTTEELREMQGLRGWSGTEEDVRDALDGTDLKVFDALNDAENETRHARADAFRMRDEINRARRNGDNDALHTVLARYTSASSAEAWGGEVVDAEERRRRVAREFAGIEGVDLSERESESETEDEAAARALFTYATRPIEVTRSAGHGETYTHTLTVTGANRNLARALIYHGESSPEARAHRLAVEENRRGGPNIVNLDTALVDDRLNPSVSVSDEERERARLERREMLEIYARSYGDENAAVDAESAEQHLQDRLVAAFGSDRDGADLAVALVADEFPTTSTAAMAMRYAMDGAGTNEKLIDRTLGRMNRDEIQEMRAIYDSGGRNLYADMGVFGYGGGDLSGDEALKAERALYGVPRNARERAEVAALAIHQQRRETGSFGRWLASGSLQERSLDYNERRLHDLMGGPLEFGPDGLPLQTANENFTEEGDYAGDSALFESAVAAASQSASNYSAKIDQYADFAGVAIAIAGAIVATAVTILTGGAAAPLLMAALAAGFGLLGMGAKAAIKGGRYGWEEAATDLGATAVQALTAGVGAKLALASRGLSSAQAASLAARGEALPKMGMLLGSQYADQLLIGATTGALGSLGQTALQEGTWEKGLGFALEELFMGTMRGAMTGTITAGITNALEEIPLGRLGGLVGANRLGESIGGQGNLLQRGAGMLGKGFVTGLGGFTAKGAELGFELGRGRYRGDSGDIFEAALLAGAQEGIQGIGEGAAELGGGAARSRVMARREAATPELESAAARAAPTPETPDIEAAETPRVGDLDVEAGAAPAETTRSREVPAAEALEPGRRAADPEGTEPERRGAAAGIPGSEFRGDAGRRTSNRRVFETAESLASGPLRHIAEVPDPDAAGKLRVRATNGEEVDVRLSVVDNMPPGPNGEVPPARFHFNADTGEYEVQVSARAGAAEIERALAHELSEIGRLHHTGELPDALRPGGIGATEEGELPRLSPHDHGRLAELDVIARQIAAAQAEGDELTVLRLQDEAERLAVHMGLAGESEGARTRRAAADAELQNRPEARALLDRARRGAEDNPFLVRRPEDTAEALDLLARQLEHARKLGNEALAEQVLDIAARKLLADDVVIGPRHRREPMLDTPFFRLEEAGDAARKSLMSEVRARIRNVESRARILSSDDPAALDPHLAEAVRMDFGDRQQFQDWPEFTDRFFGSRTSYDADNPDHLRIAFDYWSSGRYVGPGGALRSVTAAVRRPDPGFSARYADDPAGAPEIRPDADRRLPTGESVDDVVQDRRQRIQERDGLLTELEDPATTPERAREIDARLRELIPEINFRSEILGEAAGRRRAELRPGNWEEVPLPRRGAGLPDLAYEGDDGRLLIIETKGGDSPLGVRRSADGTRMVEQGTPEYLESLARTMTNSDDPVVRNLGERILLALTRTPPNVDYEIVRQPFDEQNDLGVPEVGRFDLDRGRRGPQGDVSSARPQGDIESASLPKGNGRRDTMGWSGEPSETPAADAQHLRAINRGLELLETIGGPGFKAALDDVLGRLENPNPRLQQELDALEERLRAINEDPEEIRIRSTPEDRLPESEREAHRRLNDEEQALIRDIKARQQAIAEARQALLDEALEKMQRLRHRLLSDDEAGAEARQAAEQAEIDPRARPSLRSDDEIRADIEEFLRLVGAGKVPDAGRLVVTSRTERGVATGGGRIDISEKRPKRLVFHELAHLLETAEIGRLPRSFLEARAARGERRDPPQALSDLIPRGKYRDDELALIGDFIDFYMGKIYATPQTEIVSTGLERFTDPRRMLDFYWQDPEHFLFVLGLLK